MGRHSAQHVVREPRHMGLLDIAKRLKRLGPISSINLSYTAGRIEPWALSVNVDGKAQFATFNVEVAESSQIGGDAVVEQMAEALFDKMQRRING